MRKFNSAGLEYLLVPDKAENSSVLDKAKNPLVADNGKIHSSQSKWTQTTTKISFLVYQSVLESTGACLIPYVPNFRKAKNQLVRDWGQTSIGARDFIFMNFCI